MNEILSLQQPLLRPHNHSDIQSAKHAPTSEDRRVMILKVVGLTISCFAKLVTGSVFVFFLYQGDMKIVFQYSQKQVAVLASMMNIGLGLGFLPGMLYDTKGPTATAAAGLILSCGAYLLIWNSTYYVAFFQKNFGIMVGYFLFAGFGPAFTLMVCLNTNIINYGQHHAGKVVGILNACFAGSPSIFSAVYYKYFARSTQTKGHFAEFILMIAVLFGIANVLCMLFVRLYRYQELKEDEICYQNTGTYMSQSENVSPLPNLHETENEFHKDHVPLKRLLLNADFQLLIWTFTFASTVSVVFGVNITVISRSVGLENYDSNLTIILPIANAVVSSCVGIFSDQFKLHISRLKFILFGCFCMCMCLLLVMLVPDKITALMLAAGLCGVAVAFVFSITPTFLKEMTNARNFGRNWGIALFLQSVISMPSLVLFGTIYDAENHVSSNNECLGKRCVVVAMSVFFAMAVLSTALGVILMCKNSCNNYCQRRQYNEFNNT